MCIAGESLSLFVGLFPYTTGDFRPDLDWRASLPGCFSLDELARATVFGVAPAVDRDLYWTPNTIGEIRGRSPYVCGPLLRFGRAARPMYDGLFCCPEGSR